mgnify:FL=1
MEKVFHTLNPVFDKNSRVLILGSFPSPASREIGFYYGHKQNRFWRVLSEILGEPVPPSAEDKTKLLLKRKIALWDVIYSCEINGASDVSIKNAVPNDFSVITSAANIKQVFTTGKTAAALYRRFTGQDAFALPSPSPANCAASLDTLVAAYRAILDYLD